MVNLNFNDSPFSVHAVEYIVGKYLVDCKYERALLYSNKRDCAKDIRCSNNELKMIVSESSSKIYKKYSY